MEEDHESADDLLLSPGTFDFLPPLWPDAFNVLQPTGLPFDNVENLLPEFRDQLLGVNGSNALHHGAAQVFFDSLLRCGRGADEQIGAKLEAKL